LREVQELLGSAAFDGWFGRYKGAQTAIEIARARREDLLSQAHMVRYRADLTQQSADDKLFAAAEFEDRSAQANAEFASIENDSFEALSEFEGQRQRAIDALVARDRFEKLLEDARQGAADLKARLDAAKKHTTPEGKAEAERLEMRMAEVDAQVGYLARESTAAESRRVREDKIKQDLWLRVEAAWSNSFHANMARSEYAFAARRTRAEAEQLFLRAAQERKRVEQLDAEALVMAQRISELEGAFDTLLEEGRRSFQCSLIREFMYWPHAEDVKAALTVPLIDEAKHLNIQVSAMQAYRLERGRGLDFIEPLLDRRDSDGGGADSADDPRLESFFAPMTPNPATTIR